MEILNKLKQFFINNDGREIEAKDISRYKDSSIKSSIASDRLASYQKYHHKKPNSVLCHAPYKNLYFTSLGEVVVCCHNRDFVIGRYPEQSIEEMLTGERMKELRTYLVQNNLSKGCQVCQFDMDRESYSQVKANHFDQLPYKSDGPTMMEFELDITCNLECTMCCGDCASLIRKNREHRPALIIKYDEQFVQQLKPYLSNLTETRFSGGEPFLIDIYYKIWNALVVINPNCLISVQTNGTVLNNKVKSLLEKGRFEIGISLDSLQKDIFESIRINAKFETVMTNIEYFSKYCKRKKTSFRLSICVMRNNWMDLPEYIVMCNNLGAYASFHKVTSPQELSLKTWDIIELQKVYDFLSNQEFKATSSIEISNLEHYRQYVNLIELWLNNKKNETQQILIDDSSSVSELRNQLLNSQLLAAEALPIESTQKKQLIIKINNIIAAIPDDTDKEVYLKMLRTPATEYIDKYLHLSEEQLKAKFHQNY